MSKKLIIGLGNPGEDYQMTRHNAGFMFIDYLISSSSKIIATEKKFKDSLIYSFDKDTILLKPLTFMNESGSMVKQAVKWFDIDVERNFTLVYDDLDIPLGKFKLQFAKSPKDHKGVRSVEDHLGTNKFMRLRIGVDNRNGKDIPGEKYVLGEFKKNEKNMLAEVFESIHFPSILG